MIIDLILDRKDFGAVFTDNGSVKYNANDFYRAIFDYGEIGFDITRALDCGTEQDTKRALCDYIDNEQYNPDIKDYINSVDWLIMS